MARWILVAAIVGLAGCATLGAAAPETAAQLVRAGQAEGLPLHDPLEMPVSLRALVRERIGLEGTEDERAHRLTVWLHDGRDGFTYAPGESYSAGDAWRLERGDCFAVTNLFVAAARAVDVHARYVYVREVGRYQEHHSRFVVSAHVAAEYGPGLRPVIVDFDRAPDERTLADYRVVSDGDAAALFNNNLAVQQMLHGRPHLAERMLRALIDAAPDLPELRNNLGVALNREGRPAEARDVLLDALTRSPDYGPLYTNAVAAAHATGNEDLARTLEVRGRKAAGDDPLFLFGQGLRRYELHDFRGAADRFEQALRLQDDSPVAWAWLARARLAEGRLDDGRRAFAHARQLAPDDPRLRDLLQRSPQLQPN